MFTAGTDTSSSTVEWAIAELIRHPKILAQVQQELDSVVGRDRLVGELDLAQLTYLQAVVKETFRLHPSTPLSLPRMAAESCEINGYHIPKGSTLLVNVWAISRDPKQWTNPLEFRPERFLPGSEKAHVDIKGNDFEAIPFGAGRRICAGMSLGLRMVQLLTATLVHAYDWDLPDGLMPEKLNLVPHATSFPAVILTTASFNESLWKEIGQAVSTEARAMYNLGRAGLTFWSPTINIARDPRWGRIAEAPGEDPFLVGTYAVNYVRGLQDVQGTENYTDWSSRPLKVSACCKHFTAYDVENWKGVDRYHFDARVTEQDMEETFNPPFEMCVKDGDVSGIMCSYNRVNGIPSCADPNLLKQTLRQEWDLHGYIVSDCDSVSVMVTGHNFLNDTYEDAIAQTLRAGMDLDCGKSYPKYTGNAVNQSKVRESDIDKALENLYIVLFRTGFFDGIPAYKSLGKNDICTNKSIELATQAAKEGITLLKNEGGTLPLSTGMFKNLAVVGPHANATIAMLGNYAFESKHPGSPCRYTSPIDGFSTYGKINYAAGCGDIACNKTSLIPQAVESAKIADATIILVGLDLTVEVEKLDRVDLLLPGNQSELINQVANAAKGPVILVVMCAGGVDISFAKNNPKIKAILWVGYPGEEGGRAIADVVFGLYNPGGRLPVTWYEANYVNKIPLTSMQFRPDDSKGYPGRTYKFFNGSTVFPFGFGLSYTKFNYTTTQALQTLPVKLGRHTHCHDLNYMANKTKPTCPAVLLNDLQCGEYFKLNIEVKNVGKRDGSEVVLVYSKPPDGIIGTHFKQLIGFKRIFVAAGGREVVNFVFNGCKSLGIVDYASNRLLPSGGHTIIVGDGVASFPFQVTFH